MVVHRNYKMRNSAGLKSFDGLSFQNILVQLLVLFYSLARQSVSLGTCGPTLLVCASFWYVCIILICMGQSHHRYVRTIVIRVDPDGPMVRTDHSIRMGLSSGHGRILGVFFTRIYNGEVSISLRSPPARFIPYKQL